MDQFQLSLNQVNFDEEAFGESDELHSFSNLVSYDSDFREDHSGGIPIRAKRIEQYQVADSFHCSQVNHIARVMDDARIGLGPIHFVPVSDESLQEQFHHEATSGPKSTADGDTVSDSFKAFTETVEALALQKSVIGKKRIVPVSPDEVARVVAATKARLNLENHLKCSESLVADGGVCVTSDDNASSALSDDLSSAPLRSSSSGTHAERGMTPVDPPEPTADAECLTERAGRALEATTRGKESFSENTLEYKEGLRSSQGHTETFAGKERTDSGGKTPFDSANSSKSGLSQSVHKIAQQPESSAAVGQQGTSAVGASSPRFHESGKELIRILPKEISTATEKSQSSWFWSKSSNDSNRNSMQGKANAGRNQDIHVQEKRSKRQNAGSETAGHGRKNGGDSSNTKIQSLQKATESENLKQKEEQQLDSTDGLSMRSQTAQHSSSVSEFTEKSLTSKESFETLHQTTSKATFPSSESSRESSMAESLASGRNVPSENSSSASLSSEQNENNSGRLDSAPSLALSTASATDQRILTRDVKLTISKSTTSTNVIRQSQPKNFQRVSLSDQSPLRQDSIESTFSESNDLQLRLDQILKEKVKLEGQVEVLEAESSILLRERAELLSKVAALMQELQSREKSRVGLTGDRDALSADLETLRQNRARLEAVIIDAHKLLEDKDQELKVLESDLEEARNVSTKHVDRLKSSLTDVKSRDATIADLKAKITELYVEFQTTNQNRILAENEVGSLQGELKSMAAAKEWYMNQLQSSQKEKTELQAEVTRVKGEMIAQGTSIERLKAEMLRTKRMLADSEQKSLNDKQVLARHLESIEADMMEREAVFAQMQRDRQSASDLKSENVDSETVATLQEDLNKAMSDFKRSSGQMAALHQEQAELVKRLALSQESILERDKTIESLERNAVDSDSQKKQLQLEISAFKDEIGGLEHDRTVLQMELKSAKEEKEVFDVSLRSLKGDMSKVEKSFRLMKQELLTKQEELERLKAEIGKPQLTFDFASEQRTKQLLEIQTGYDFSPVHSIVKSLTRHQHTETQTDIESDDKTAEEEEGDASNGRTVERSVLERVEGEKVTIEKQLTELKEILAEAESEKRQLSTNAVSLEQELVVLRERCIDLELRLQQVCVENDRLTSERSTGSTEQTKTDKRVSEEKQEAVDSWTKAAEESEVKLTQILAENTDLRSKLGDLQRESHKENAKQKTKILKLGKQLESALKDYRESSLSHDQLVADLNQQLTVLQNSNKRLEDDLTSARQRASLDLDEKTSQMHQELQRLSEEMETMRSAKHSTELELSQTIVRYQLEIEEYHSRYVLLELELQAAKSYIDERKAVDIETANLALELEREKGRLAGFLKSHSTLKEHASLLEANLASKESSVVQMSSEVEEELRVRDRQVVELKEQVGLLEDSLAKEQQNAKDIRKQLLTEKGNHVKARRELEQLSSNHHQVVQEVEQLRKELTRMAEVEEQLKGEQVTQKMKVEELSTEMKAMKHERDRLSRELEDKTTRDGMLLEQIQSLEWKLAQKTAEMEAADERGRLIEERSQTEALGLNNSLLTATSELFAVREELATIKSGKAELKAKVMQLKQVLISIVEQCTKATEAGKAITIQMIMNKEEIEKLLEDNAAPSVESKPLSFLQATLSGLRGEISCLQKQVNEHTSVVQNSSQAWRQLEAQVEDLRQVCKSSAAHRAESDRLLKTAEELSQLPPLTDIQLTLQLPSSGPLVLPGNRVNVIKTTLSTTKHSSKTSTVEVEENKRT